MIDTSSKQSAKRVKDLNYPPFSVRDKIRRDDEDSLSFVNESITIIGILLAILTIFLPAISVLLERPLPSNKGAEINQFFKKDGY